jgi:hypothetical protein
VVLLLHDAPQILLPLLGPGIGGLQHLLLQDNQSVRGREGFCSIAFQGALWLYSSHSDSMPGLTIDLLAGCHRTEHSVT